jgi:ribosome-interacting GTPase 1
MLGALSKAAPASAPYPFTTQTVIPGMLEFENIQIQLLDTPPLTEQPEWWLLNLIKRADALLVLVDLSESPLEQMEGVIGTLRGKHIGLQGMSVEDEELVLSTKKALVACNKVDLDSENSFEVLSELYGGQLPLVAVSATEGTGLEELKRVIYRTLDIIRVYTKAPGNKADYTDPIILPTGSNLEDAAISVHKDFAARLKYARIWGSGKHDGIMIRRDHILQDGDVIELHM